MAFAKNDYNQMSFDDSTFRLTDREKRFLEKSWAKPFAEILFPAIREEDFSILYSDKASRPNTPVNIIIGSLILKELVGLTDDEIVESLMFDIRFQYALHTTSFKEQPLSDRSLSRFRERCMTYETQTGHDLIKQCINSLSREIAKVMNLTPTMIRMDSLLIASNIKNLSRLELFYVCVANMVKKMYASGEKIPEALQRYLDERDYNQTVYRMKSVELEERIKPILLDIEFLSKHCAGTYDDCSEYQLLIRLMNEQTFWDEDGSLQMIDKHSLESSFMVNPADPDATIRKKGTHKHVGYTANIVESVGESGSLITDYSYEQNTYHDSHFLQDYLEQYPEDEEDITIVTDGSYSNQAVIKDAAKRGIKIITTNFTGHKPADCLAEFKFTDDGEELLCCAGGHPPYRQIYDSNNDRCNAYFSREQCEKCPHFMECNPKLYKNHVKKEVSWKSVIRAQQLRFMKTEEYIKYADFRNGIEAIPSLLRRKYDVDTVPVRGKCKTRLFFGFKIAAINLTKLLGYIDGLDSPVLLEART
jgi:hypothetical protein